MERSDAKLYGQLAALERAVGRRFYAGDVVNFGILPKAKSQEKLDELTEAGFLTEGSLRGANVYGTNAKGLAHMTAYRDLRIEYEAAI